MSSSRRISDSKLPGNSLIKLYPAILIDDLVNLLTLTPSEISERLRLGKLTVAAVGWDGSQLPIACMYGLAGAKLVVADKSFKVINALEVGGRVKPASILSKLKRRGMLEATVNFEKAVSEADVIDILVSTTVSEVGRPDYTRLYKASEDVGRGMGTGKLVISSTATPPGLTEAIVKSTLERYSGLRAGEDFGLAFSPFKREVVGSRKAPPPRILAAVDGRSLEAAEAVLQTVYGGKILRIPTIKVAEAVRMFESVFEYTFTVLSHELAGICEETGLDYLEICRFTAKLGLKLPEPGLSLRGYVYRDAGYFSDLCEAYKIKTPLLNTALKLGGRLHRRGLSLIREAAKLIGKPLRRCKIGYLGVSARADVRELEESVSFKLASTLVERRVYLKVYDPYFSKSELEEAGLPAAKTVEEAVEEADCLVVAVGHRRFKTLFRRKLGALKALMASNPVIVDFARIVDPSKASNLGFSYVGLGRGAAVE